MSGPDWILVPIDTFFLNIFLMASDKRHDSPFDSQVGASLLYITADVFSGR